MRRLVLSIMIVLLGSGMAAAQMKIQSGVTKPVATKPAQKPAPKPAPKKAAPAPKLPPAKDLFGSAASPAPLAARAIGSYSKGCLAGGQALPINGPDWQVMRLSRNRYWGSPQLMMYLERLSSDARALDGWPGLLVGDLSQPRGGPMLTGHTSHQVGLDADIWLTPMPDRTLTLEEREEMEAVSMLKDPFSVDPKVFTDLHVKLIRRAASYPEVARIFVHPAIKKSLCERADVAGTDRTWLGKVRPWWNHHYHFHVRLACPPSMAGCENQAPVAGDDGCGGQELANWDDMLKKSAIWMAEQKIRPDTKPAPQKKPMGLNELPADCKAVLTAGDNELPTVDDELPPIAMKAVASKEAGPGVPVLTQAQLEIVRSGGKLGMPLPERNPVR
jgi:penicillin-insensitive murein DD-endopeptidase